jgi:hypothetical protein
VRELYALLLEGKNGGEFELAVGEGDYLGGAASGRRGRGIWASVSKVCDQEGLGERRRCLGMEWLSQIPLRHRRRPALGESSTDAILDAIILPFNPSVTNRVRRKKPRPSTVDVVASTCLCRMDPELGDVRFDISDGFSASWSRNRRRRKWYVREAPASVKQLTSRALAVLGSKKAGEAINKRTPRAPQSAACTAPSLTSEACPNSDR